MLDQGSGEARGGSAGDAWTPDRRSFIRRVAEGFVHIGLIGAGLSPRVRAVVPDPSRPTPGPDGGCNYTPTGAEFAQPDIDCGSEGVPEDGWGADQDCGVTSGPEGQYYTDEDCGILDDIGASISGWSDEDCGLPVGEGVEAGVAQDDDCGIADLIGGGHRDDDCGSAKPGGNEETYSDDDCGIRSGISNFETHEDNDETQNPQGPTPNDPGEGS